MKTSTGLKLDRRRNMYAVIDTETAGSIGSPLVYDLGVSIIDKQGRIYAQGNWLIKEIFFKKSLMDNAYYGNKRPLYYKMLENDEIGTSSLKGALYQVNQMLEEWEVSTIMAYNLQFDLRAIDNSWKKSGNSWKSHGSIEWLWKDYQIQDIWGMACETIYQSFTFKQQAIEYDKFTKAGNPLTNAEVGYQFLEDDHTFKEDHTALSDTVIEAKIFAHCVRQKKKYTRGIVGAPWQKVKKCFTKKSLGLA